MLLGWHAAGKRQRNRLCLNKTAPSAATLSKCWVCLLQLGRSIDEDYREQAQLPLPEKSLEEERQETRAAAAKGVSKAAQVTCSSCPTIGM